MPSLNRWGNINCYCELNFTTISLSNNLHLKSQPESVLLLRLAGLAFKICVGHPFYQLSVDRFGNSVCGQINSVPNFFQIGPQTAEKKMCPNNFWRKKHQPKLKGGTLIPTDASVHAVSVHLKWSIWVSESIVLSPQPSKASSFSGTKSARKERTSHTSETVEITEGWESRWETSSDGTVTLSLHIEIRRDFWKKMQRRLLRNSGHMMPLAPLPISQIH